MVLMRQISISTVHVLVHIIIIIIVLLVSLHAKIIYLHYQCNMN